MKIKFNYIYKVLGVVLGTNTQCMVLLFSFWDVSTCEIARFAHYLLKNVLADATTNNLLGRKTNIRTSGRKTFKHLWVHSQMVLINV